MKIDFYTKAVLTVIAVMLSVIALKQIVSPTPLVHAAVDTSGIQFAVGSQEIYLYDRAASTVTIYNGYGNKGEVIHLR